jgi:hypothetical protein
LPATHGIKGVAITWFYESFSGVTERELNADPPTEEEQGCIVFFKFPLTMAEILLYYQIVIYREMIHEGFSESYEGPFRSKPGQNRQDAPTQKHVRVRNEGRIEYLSACRVKAFEIT